MEIVLASGNMHKLQELQKILKGHTLLLPKDLGVEFDPEETGKTFYENALIKAEDLYSKVKRPVLADDSGICVNALRGGPGIYSARYGAENGVNLSDADRNALLLKNIEGAQDRRAFFVCNMVLILEPYRVFSIQETFSGSIGTAPFGGGGFGYDPIFICDEKGVSAAQLSEDEKNLISHRGRAGQRVRALLDSLEI